MAEEKATQKGGFHFGSVGGDVSMEAGGDIVAGDKITTVNQALEDDKNKEEFVKQIEDLRSMMRQMKSEIDKLESVDEDSKDEINLEIMQQINELKKVTEEVNKAKAGGNQIPKDKVETICKYLDSTSTVMDKLKKIGEKAGDFAEKVGPIFTKALPILLSARHLIGLP